ncbi:MaoC/PaaZ C-terminal domain-containing protein [Stappia stellulata]|uniref:MaoC/PaaZ C-terminal domain-containing protein n=1 Tax=Stappia stellulata TaxID=71235 RepID=UPI00040AC016|nr:MaoC/PaaZ C-terminal domain-containing protein [Stappia stellulata]
MTASHADDAVCGEPSEIVVRWTPVQVDFDRFAALSGDDNPIHVDPAFSARTRFGRTVSHGMLLYSRLWALIRTRWPGCRHALQDLMFPNPAYAEEELTIAVVPGDTDADDLAITIRRVADDAEVLRGRCRLGDAPGAGANGPETSAPDGPDRDTPQQEALAVGRSAELMRLYPSAQASDFAALARLDNVPDTVPEPLIGGMFSYLLGVKLPGFGTNYLKQEMTFHAPAGFDVPLRARVTVTRLRPEKHLVDLETVCETLDGEVICTGRALVYVEDVGA